MRLHVTKRGPRLVGAITQKLDLYNPYLPRNRRRSLMLGGAFILSLAGTILWREMVLLSLVVTGAAGLRTLAWRRPIVVEQVQLDDAEMSYSGMVMFGEWLDAQLEMKLARASVKAIQLAPRKRLLVHDGFYEEHGVLILTCDTAPSLHLGSRLGPEQSQTLLDELREHWPETAVELSNWDPTSVVSVMLQRSRLEPFAQSGQVTVSPRRQG